MVGIRVEVSSATIEYDKKRLRRALRQAGAEVARTTRNLILASSGSGETRPGRNQASAPGQAPVSQSGNLAASISVKPSKSGESVTVRDSAFYALILEAGAKGGGGRKGSRNRRGRPQTARVMESRPFLSTALDSLSDRLGERIRASIVQDIALRKVK